MHISVFCIYLNMPNLARRLIFICSHQQVNTEVIVERKQQR